MRERQEKFEFPILILLSVTGMMVMATANDLITVFLSLEILSIALYVLAAFDRRRITSQESGLKYFIPTAPIATPRTDVNAQAAITSHGRDRRGTGIVPAGRSGSSCNSIRASAMS